MSSVPATAVRVKGQSSVSSVFSPSSASSVSSALSANVRRVNNVQGRPFRQSKLSSDPSTKPIANDIEKSVKYDYGGKADAYQRSGGSNNNEDGYNQHLGSPPMMSPSNSAKCIKKTPSSSHSNGSHLSDECSVSSACSVDSC